MSDQTSQPRLRVNLSAVPPRYRDKVKHRLSVVIAYEGWLRRSVGHGRTIGELTEDFLKQPCAQGVSRGTLYNWRRAYRNDGLAGLIDQRSDQARPDALRFLAELRRRYVGRGLLPIWLCFDLAMEEAQKRGWQVCTLREASRYIRREVLPELTRERGMV